MSGKLKHLIISVDKWLCNIFYVLNKYKSPYIQLCITGYRGL